MRRNTALALLPTLLAANAGATQWHTLGPRAMGMGGAQVAIAQGPLASYWNPGGLGQLYNSDGFELPFGLRAEVTGTVVQGANDLYQLNKDCSSGNPNCTQARINSALSNLGQPNNGALLDGGLGANLKIGRVVVFANDFAYVGANPIVDLTNTTPATINNNRSKLAARGGNFIEVGAGYGREILETGLSVGATGKLIIGRIGYFQQNIVTDNPEDGSALKDFNTNLKTSVAPAVDLGALWDMRETFPGLPWRPRLGVVGRNINNPSFSQPDAALAAGEPGHFHLNGQARAGFALSPLKSWNIAADVDLTDNLTPISGVHSRYVAVGTEYNLFNTAAFNMPLRAGIQKNVANVGASALSYTAGFGFHCAGFLFDLAGMVSSKSVTTQSEGDSTTVPSNAAVSARLAYMFGGADEGGRNK